MNGSILYSGNILLASALFHSSISLSAWTGFLYPGLHIGTRVASSIGRLFLSFSSSYSSSGFGIRGALPFNWTPLVCNLTLPSGTSYEPGNGATVTKDASRRPFDRDLDAPKLMGFMDRECFLGKRIGFGNFDLFTSFGWSILERWSVVVVLKLIWIFLKMNGLVRITSFYLA